jgi:hypothetical protein
MKSIFNSKPNFKFNRFNFLLNKLHSDENIFQIDDSNIPSDKELENYNVVVYSNDITAKSLEVINHYTSSMKDDSLFIIENIKDVNIFNILKENVKNSFRVNTYELKDTNLFTFRIKHFVSDTDLSNTKKYEKIKIVINSHNKSTIALNHLLESMRNHPEFSNFEHIIFVGGYYDNKEYVQNKVDKNIKYIYCNHNSIDFTSFIALTEIDEYYNSDNYYFYMHDTCKIGINFYKKINIDISSITSAKIHGRYSMNIGIYSQKIINNFKDFLLTKKNTDESKCMQFKTIDYNEDYIFHNDPNNILLENYSGWLYKGPFDYYNTGTMRLIEYYPNVDLYKIKANWGLGGEWTLKN